ncbi:hypothetical protein CLH39_01950 [Alcaligenes faecalis]|uniref:O-antigen ligase family protein n=1 Tax=Alcaligenes faecalis TaxID=511 RepID=UPI0019341E60|nr:O-antigen ligase family protein [Alcaligenes faecalis]QRF89069.1 hypothetical protein CLH39_01950 [Alcaligenes faecalis]
MNRHSLLYLFAKTGLLLSYALYLAWDRGPLFGVGILLIGGLLTLGLARPQVQHGPYRKLIGLLAACSLMWFAINAYHGEPSSSYDLASRYLLCVLVLLLFIDHLPSFKWFLGASALGAIISAGVGGWEFYVLNYPRADGYTGVIQFGNIALMLGIFSLSGALYHLPGQPSWHKALCLVGGIMGFYASFMSGSRGGWIALPFVALLILISQVNKSNLKRVMATVVVLMIVLTVAAFNSRSFNERMEMLQYDVQQYAQGNPDTSIGNRFALWVEALRLIRQQPVLGYPSREYRAELQKVADAQPKLSAAMGLANTHNSFLEILVFYGFLGLLPFLALLAYGLRYFLPKLRASDTQQRAIAMCGSALIINYIIFSQSQVMFHRNNTLIFFLISLVYFWVGLAQSSQAITNKFK